MMPGKQTITAVPFVASQERLCRIKARSALDLGATPGRGKARIIDERALESPPT